MNKDNFIFDLKKSLTQHYKEIKLDEEILSYGIYTDGDASTIGIYYNTYEHLQSKLKVASKKYSEESFEPLYYVFFMEEWKKDISELIKEELLDKLNQKLYDFGNKEYDIGNEDYKDEIYDLFITALKEFKNDIQLNNTRDNFFLHLEVSDSWNIKNMRKKIINIKKPKHYE